MGVTSAQDEQGRFDVIDQFGVDKLERELKAVESDNNSDKDAKDENE